VSDELDLLDWKRRVFALYAEVRAEPEPQRAWRRWREGRDELFRTHPQSPLPESARASFGGVDYFDYDPALRIVAEAVPASDERRELANGRFRRFAVVRCELGELPLYWLEGYGGGVFLPFGDATNGRETYGGGRYLLDTVKGADLGTQEGRLVLDFNFAYNPSCSYDDRWACPLPQRESRLAVDVRAGERA
jgi:uncharacterized protein (DUF1684 family)